MNTAAAHLITDVTVWIEHEEIIVLSYLKKALRFMECEIEAIFVLGLFGICIVNIIVRLSQLSQYAQLISCCD